MSAESLRAAVISDLEKQAGDIANSLINVSTSQSCEQIALYVAGLRGAATGLQKAVETINREYRKLTAPDEAPPKRKVQEAY